MTPKAVLVLATAWFGITGVAAAQSRGMTPEDLEVLARLHQSNQMEIEAGQFARQKAAAAAVKRFGNLLVQDHRHVDQLLTTFAETRGVTTIPRPFGAWSQELGREQHATMQRLQELRGRPFDREFAKAMVQSHQETSTVVADAIDHVDDAGFQDLLRRLEPILHQHLTIARGLTPLSTSRR